MEFPLEDYKKLTDKAKKFLEEYVRNGENVQKAYKLAGYSDPSEGYRMTCPNGTHRHSRSYLEWLRYKRAEEFKVDVNGVKSEVVRMFHDPETPLKDRIQCARIFFDYIDTKDHARQEIMIGFKDETEHD